MCAAKTAAVGELSWFFLFQSGVIRVLVAVVRMIRYLWARDSTAWLLGEWGIGDSLVLLPSTQQTGSPGRAPSRPM